MYVNIYILFDICICIRDFFCTLMFNIWPQIYLVLSKDLAQDGRHAKHSREIRSQVSYTYRYLQQNFSLYVVASKVLENALPKCINSNLSLLCLPKGSFF